MQDLSSTSQDSKTPLISFIVTVYNLDASLVIECIDSILALTLRPHEREIIVVDDGSDVCFLPELGSLQDEVIYCRQRNSGVSEARNMGLLIATGRYIQFVDGDDKLHSPMYDHCLDMARYDKADLVMFDFCNADNPPVTYEDSAPKSGTELMRHQNLHGAAWGYLFRRSILGDLRFTPQTSYGEDEEFTAKLVLRGEQVVRTSAKAYYYRKRASSAIQHSERKTPLNRLDDNREVIQRLTLVADRLPLDQRLALQRRIHQLTMDYIYNVLRLERNADEQTRRIEELRQAGLFPLPDRDYTAKYKWFRRLSSTKVGLSLLKAVIPMTHER